ncbi:MAG: hypothetical protein GAK28_01324 [Luteibacter sp.]|uniref:lysozyme inhibitor LprI family protein n=1 Tax=Luteibacter sp. TaxID=1886636 RepID=UPI0013802F6E|nr:lysozyme inhibitor LprI family protein [Luteibacter sp.]KAF1007848.1 MAG: hypothetical protein GAK28_01324 [Luteibacter sp.]
MKGLVGLAWVLLLPGMANAAGFDCAKASSAAEKLVCATPKLSTLDAELGKVYQDAIKAHPELAEAIRLDQRHWLAERDDTTWTFQSGTPVDEFPKMLADLYQRRIDILSHIGQKPGGPLDVVQKALPDTGGASDLVQALAARHVITLAKDVEIKDAKSLPFQPDATLRGEISFDNGNVTNRVLEGSPIGSAYSIGGTAHCVSEAPYRLDGKKAAAVDMPPVWGEDCMTTHALARVGNDIVALRMDDGNLSEVVLAASQWKGASFGPAVELVSRFDRTLSLSGAICGPKEMPCADFGKLALQYATRYAARPQPGTIDKLDKGMDKATYTAAVAAATAPGGIAPKGSDNGFADLPMFGQNIAGYRMTGYASEATFFPIAFRGETLLGMIGHGHVGWRANEDWLVSAWRLKQGKLEPVASAYIEVAAGKFLYSSPIPVKAP